MSGRRRLGPARWGNCWTGFAALLFTLRARGVVVVWDGFMPHVGAITRRGNIAHFTHRRGSGRGRPPWWFHGGYEVVNGSAWDRLPSTWRKECVRD